MSQASLDRLGSQSDLSSGYYSDEYSQNGPVSRELEYQSSPPTPQARPIEAFHPALSILIQELENNHDDDEEERVERHDMRYPYPAAFSDYGGYSSSYSTPFQYHSYSNYPRDNSFGGSSYYLSSEEGSCHDEDEEEVHGERWARDEHERFLAGYKCYGKDWRALSSFLRTRSPDQIRRHALKYFQKEDKIRLQRGVEEVDREYGMMYDAGSIGNRENRNPNISGMESEEEEEEVEEEEEEEIDDDALSEEDETDREPVSNKRSSRKQYWGYQCQKKGKDWREDDENNTATSEEDEEDEMETDVSTRKYSTLVPLVLTVVS